MASDKARNVFGGIMVFLVFPYYFIWVNPILAGKVLLLF